MSSTEHSTLADELHDQDALPKNMEQVEAQDITRPVAAASKEYPHGFRLFVIVAALFTSMFLLALDLV